MTKSIDIAAIILAAGKGDRYDKKHLKQYENINGKPVLYYSVEPFKMNLFNSLNDNFGNGGLFFKDEKTDQENTPSDDLMCLKISKLTNVSLCVKVNSVAFSISVLRGQAIFNLNLPDLFTIFKIFVKDTPSNIPKSISLSCSINFFSL